MAYINRSYLEKQRSETLYRNYIATELSSAEITVFLSHSHKDKELAEGFQNALASCGIKVYVDWQDSTLPQTPSRETAEKIKGKIYELDLFILLATNNSLSSRWCPWEIGIADSVKAYENILIVPVIEDSGEFKGSEYLQLYKRVEVDMLDNLWVIEPEFNDFGTKFFRTIIELAVENSKFSKNDKEFNLFESLCDFLRKTYDVRK